MIKQILNWIRTAKPFWTKEHAPSHDEKNLLVNIVEEELSELSEAITLEDREEILDAVVDLCWVALNSAVAFGFDNEEILQHFKTVQDSNYSKFCKSRKEATDTIVAYAEGTHPSKPGQQISCMSAQIGDLYVVYREDGKIMKSINFKEPCEYNGNINT